LHSAGAIAALVMHDGCPMARESGAVQCEQA
jgi:hypothetical protein